MKNSDVEITALLEALPSAQQYRTVNGIGWHVEEFSLPGGWKAITAPYETFQDAVEAMRVMPNVCGAERRVYEALSVKERGIA